MFSKHYASVLLVLAFSWQGVYAQNTFDPNGGIGILKTSSGSPIAITGNDGTIFSRSTDPTQYSGMNMIDENGALGASFQYGNSNSVFPNTMFLGTRKAGAPLIFLSGQGANERMRISPDGNVGIGTSNINDLNYRLFVENGIRTRKVKVDQVIPWPDYVFHVNYGLKRLVDVEEFIKRFHHLPDVPSAEEVRTNGIDLGSNQAILLKKVEELTLYVIEQNKKLLMLQKQLEQISEKVKRKGKKN